tara:strand:- start:884 stop:1183 length:300 start_codon:yes stop_codon:yes gene_type:complete
MSVTTISSTVAGAIATLAVAGVIASASGLVEVARVDERINSHNVRITANEQEQDSSSVRQMGIQRDVEVVKERVRNIDEHVKRNGEKIDQILDRLPRAN